MDENSNVNQPPVSPIAVTASTVNDNRSDDDNKQSTLQVKFSLVWPNCRLLSKSFLYRYLYCKGDQHKNSKDTKGSRLAMLLGYGYPLNYQQSSFTTRGLAAIFCPGVRRKFL